MIAQRAWKWLNTAWLTCRRFEMAIFITMTAVLFATFAVTDRSLADAMFAAMSIVLAAIEWAILPRRRW